ncbi:thioredoxin domain-containing protein 5-like [Photinus pyralis]|uniref:thioredoxin domain-containing protein 5-like n=1 Tax=Photinus pyralis TaxID=7054 RepID=UPI001266EC87|nr:thioredoxin domain-containing protein 5-like [Photinus pyralis]
MNFLPLFFISVGLVLPLGLNGNVIELTDANFDEITSQNKIIVKFYVPWCGYCLKIKNDFISLATKLKDENSEIQAGEVDCDKQRRACKGIKGLPTLRFYRKGSPTLYYTGPRTLNSMYKFLTTGA